MIEISFTKLHGAENDFLLTWRDETPVGKDLPAIARRICARTTGLGADGWMLLERSAGGLRTRLFNSDGSEPEISGNGTRCAAAFALLRNICAGPHIDILTAAGLKRLRLIERASQTRFLFEMDMGLPTVDDLHAKLVLSGETFDAAALNVGNPQCVLFVNAFPENWRDLAAQAERHARFPQRSNVSVVRPLGRHSLEVRFFERGAGETRSSGTGSTGAAVAAILRDVSESPVEVQTPAGSLHVRWDESVFLTGPVEVIGEGRFFLEL